MGYIRRNHVALVKADRAGEDVMVMDAALATNAPARVRACGRARV
jgi:hypothetical protein